MPCRLRPTTLSVAKLTLNHDPAPVGAHIDFMYGRTNGLVNAGLQGDYIEQAFISLKPPKAKGFEADFGKWVTSAGAEVIDWSRYYGLPGLIDVHTHMTYISDGGRGTIVRGG